MSHAPQPLSLDDVRHVARLGRLALPEERLGALKDELVAILGHIAQLQAVNTEGLEAMAHPTGMTNRLREDEPGPTLTTAQVLANAPQVEGDFIAVPKVLGGDSA